VLVTELIKMTEKMQYSYLAFRCHMVKELPFFGCGIIEHIWGWEICSLASQELKCPRVETLITREQRTRLDYTLKIDRIQV